jgi:nucleotide-binding universal stress UspA family protein
VCAGADAECSKRRDLRSNIDDLNPPRSILVVVDFSAASHAALVLAGRLARHSGAALHVLFVEDAWLDTAAERVGIDAAAASRVELRRLIREAWPASDCSPQLHIVAGSAVTVILDVAHAEGVDLIVIPSCHQSLLERLTFTATTTERLLRRSHVSVLVAPMSWTPAESSLNHLSAADPDATLDAILGTSVRIVRGVKGAVAPVAYRALSAATIPLLLLVESLLE